MWLEVEVESYERDARSSNTTTHIRFTPWSILPMSKN
jgi:hypothetical protein